MYNGERVTGEDIKIARIKRKMRATELADKLGIDKRRMSHFESGLYERSLNENFAPQLQEIFGEDLYILKRLNKLENLAALLVNAWERIPNQHKISNEAIYCDELIAKLRDYIR